ncbi:MAG: LamG domain-containing protein [Ginsengibacter sp.]
MKILHFVAIAIVVCFCFSVTTGLTSCTKDHTMYDTTIIKIHDTTVLNVHDTTVIRDSIYDLKNGLVAYYSFNDGSLTDSSIYKNDIIFNSATKTADRFGNPNNAYLFNGTSSYMEVKNSSSLNPDNITLYAIVKVNGFYTGPCAGNRILSKGYPDYANGFYNLAFEDPTSNCGTPNLNNEVFSGGYGDNNPQGTQAGASDNSPIVTGQWDYVAFTYDGLTAKLYVNGVLKDSKQKLVTFTDNSSDLFIGKHGDPPYPYFIKGVIDEIRIYNRALSANEIKQLIKLQY